MASKEQAKRRDVAKQEQVVAVLWEFARDLKLRPERGTVATAQDGVRVSLDHVGKAMSHILNIFGYQVTRID